MRYLIYTLIFISCIHSGFSSSTEEDLKEIKSFVNSDIDKAIELSEKLLERASQNQDSYGIVKANFYLGHLLKKKEEYGKSVLYYLEAIRQADNLFYEKIESDRISLRKNIANTFRIFEANNLATIYNLKAIEIAKETNNIKQLINIKFNQGLVYQNNKEFEKAAQFFSDIVDLVDKGSYFEGEIINQLGLVYLEDKEYDKAQEVFENLLDSPLETKLFEAKALHNLGEIAYERGDIKGSISYLLKGIEIMSKLENRDNYALFLSYRNLGGYLYELGNLEESKEILTKAEDIAEYAKKDASSFQIYKTFSSLYYSEGNKELGKLYSDIYFNKIQNYLETQEELQRKNREYNFDLITKRYFDEVKKQEQIASILFYSKLISGSLLGLLLLVIAYNYYQKNKLRKSIEKELVKLNLIN